MRLYLAVSSGQNIKEDNPILAALNSQIPVKREDTLLFGERVSIVSGAFGDAEKTGVLYLEIDNSQVDVSSMEPVLRFKAIQQCLNECLNLKREPSMI